jgi:hypothetical protein
MFVETLRSVRRRRCIIDIALSWKNDYHSVPMAKRWITLPVLYENRQG